MEKIIILVLFSCLVLVVCGTTDSRFSGDIATRNDLDDFDIEEIDEAKLFDFPSWTSERGSKVLVNVDALGAVGDGISDDTKVNGVVKFNYMAVCSN